MSTLTHLDQHGQARMVDVGAKEITARSATATGRVRMAPETLALIGQGAHKKGDVLAVARIAGIQAAKRCPELIPLCHSLMLSGVDVDLQLDEGSSCVLISATARVTGQTGVEMEALTAVSVAALTVYDMCKAVDKAMVIEGISLQKKSGGRSGHYHREG